MFTSVGGPELIIIFLVILVLFGANKLPELARGFGKGMNEFKKASDNLKNEIAKGQDEINSVYESSFEEQWAIDEDDDDVEVDEDIDSEDIDSIDSNGEETKEHKDNN